MERNMREVIEEIEKRYKVEMIEIGIGNEVKSY